MRRPGATPPGDTRREREAMFGGNARGGVIGQGAFQIDSMDIASSKGSRWSDPELRGRGFQPWIFRLAADIAK